MIDRETPNFFKLAMTGWGLAGFAAGLLLVNSGEVRLIGQHQANSLQHSLADDRAETQPLVFASESGMVLNYIQPDKTLAFDFMIGELRAAMEESRHSRLRDQAARWRVLRATESGPDRTAVYMFVIYRPVPNTDYRVSTVVAEAIPRNSDEFYERLVSLYASPQTVVDMPIGWGPRRADLERDQLVQGRVR